MSQIPRVALFEPDQELDTTIRPLFQRNEYSVRVVKSHSEAQELVHEEAATFDVLVIPLQLSDGSSGIAGCIQSKANPTLSGIPILAITPSNERAILQAVYGAGADVVLSFPIDEDAFFLQVNSLARMHRNFYEHINKSIHDTGLMHPVVQAFHSMRQGFLLFNPNGTVVFGNQSAHAMLGVTGSDFEIEYKKVARQFKPILKEHDASIKLEQEHNYDAVPTTKFDVTLYRLDNQTLRAVLTVSSVLVNETDLVGFSVALTNVTEIHHLGNTLSQAQRTRSLCLNMSVAAIRLLEQASGSMLLSPYKAVEDYLASAPRRCSLDRSIAALLETLDVAVNPSVAIKVRIARDMHLAISEPDFFVLMGHIVLHAVEHAGTTGEILISSGENTPGQGVPITVSSEAQKSTPFVLKDEISQLIRSDYTNVSSMKDLSDKFSFGLFEAQAIAEKYRTSVEYQDNQDTVIRIRVCLPASGGPQKQPPTE